MEALPQASGDEQAKMPEVRFGHLAVDAAGPVAPWLKTVGDLAKRYSSPRPALVALLATQ